MKTWQEPGTTGRAEWVALSSDPLWEDNGGVWVHEVEPDCYLVVVLQPDCGFGEPGDMHAHARWVDLGQLTYPERAACGGEELDLLALIQRGWGQPIGSKTGTNPLHVRAKVKGLAVAHKPWNSIDRVRSAHHVRWDKMRVESPVDYMAGFLLGMRKGKAVAPDESEAFRAGWRHGWEYAVGRAPLPAWFERARAAAEQ